MRLDRFTQTFQQAISDAQSLALGKDHQFIEPAHLMLALLNQNGSSVIPLLKSAGIDVYSLRTQISAVIDQIKTNPNSRRHIVSAWNVGELPSMALAPCHILFQFYVLDGKLSCQLYQRSADIFLGVPFNIASYALLTHMIANVCDLEVGDFVHTLGDAHLYTNHFNQAEEQLSRLPLSPPQIKVAKKDSIDLYEFDDFELIDYQHHPHIPAVVAV